jgi:PucR C-terminal helix-turn-helix domain/GGDEF-like domain
MDGQPSISRATQFHRRGRLERRLVVRREELERLVMDRIAAIADPGATADPSYLPGLRAALAAALDYGFAAITDPQRDPAPVPIELLSQARLAARNGVSFDAVMRRYAAGHSLFADVLLDEAMAAGIEGAELKSALRALAVRYDRIVVAVSEEYGHEQRPIPASGAQRRAERVKRLLEGDPVDASELGYELDRNHLGLVAAGAGAQEAIGGLVSGLDRRLLLVAPDETTAWAWLGGRRSFEAEELAAIRSVSLPPEVTIAVGEPGGGIAGWRLSHRQAAAALPVALRSDEAFVAYADVALLASMLQDDLLATSLRKLYLDPFNRERDGGAALRTTLRAYFSAERSVSSAASALGVKRHTVTNRLRIVQTVIGRPLGECFADLEAALRLADLDT